MTKTLRIVRRRPAGFFSNFFFVLGGMHFADKWNLVPMIDFPPVGNKFLKSSLAKSWSDYFAVQQPLAGSLEGDYLDYVQTSELQELQNIDLENLGDLRNRYLPFSVEFSDGLEKLSNSLENMKKGRVLGIHYRGKDMFWAPSHPTPLTPRQMVEALHCSEVLTNFDTIFVATDTPRFVDLLSHKVHLPVITRSNLTFIENQKVDPVTEVIHDAWILSICDGLVHSESNVSWAARIFRGREYSVRLQVSLGTNPKHLPKAVLKYIIRRTLPQAFRNEKVRIESNGSRPPDAPLGLIPN